MNILLYLLTALDRIPATFLGVVVGSFFSILGVYLTNRSSEARLRAQFEHERKLKTKDREMTLKKEIYLVASEAISAGIQAIYRFVDLNLTDMEVMTAYIEKAPAIAKVHVIAEIDTVKGMVFFTEEIGLVWLKLFARRFELMAVKKQITLLDNQSNEFEKERQRFLALMQQHVIEGVVNEQRWAVLKNGFDFEKKGGNDAIAKSRELVQGLAPKLIEFMKECTLAATKIGELVISLLCSIRQELELPFDQEDYRSIIRESVLKQVQALDEFLQKIRPTTATPNDQSDVAK